jgi:hypothetical protein
MYQYMFVTVLLSNAGIGVVTVRAMPKTTSMGRRRGRPPKNSWFNPNAARGRLQELDRAMETLQSERALLEQILGQARTQRSNGVLPRAEVVRAVAGARARRGGKRRGRRGGPSLLDVIEKIMAAQSAKRWTVGELREEMLKVVPDRASAANASALISSALVQALRAKSPRFAGSRGGRGHARKYRLTASRGSGK